MEMPKLKKTSILFVFVTVILVLVYEIRIEDIESRIKIIQLNTGASPLPAMHAITKIKELEIALYEKIKNLEHSATLKDIEISTLKNKIKEIEALSESSGFTILSYNSDGFSILENKYAKFIVQIAKTTPARNGLEVMIEIINPTLLSFPGAKLELSANGIGGESVVNIQPQKNFITILISPINPEDITLFSLNMTTDRILM